MRNKPSIVYPEDQCAVCKATNKTARLEKHHIFYGTANRKLSDQDGLTVYLCPKHHRWIPDGVHGGNTKLDNELKITAQMVWMKENHKTIEDFIKRYGKSYIEVIQCETNTESE